jgi:hypothetical protein
MLLPEVELDLKTFSVLADKTQHRDALHRDITKRSLHVRQLQNTRSLVPHAPYTCMIFLRRNALAPAAFCLFLHASEEKSNTSVVCGAEWQDKMRSVIG